MTQLKFAKPVKRVVHSKKSITKPKVKRESISKLKKKLMLLVKAYVKERDKHICQKCGQRVEGSNCHVSHVIPVSAGNVLMFNPTNMNVLCYHDHLNWWHKNPIEAADWYKNKFPDRWDFLEANRHNIVKWTALDYKMMISDYKKYDV